MFGKSREVWERAEGHKEKVRRAKEEEQKLKRERRQRWDEYLPRILTISARDYCEMRDRRLRDYIAQGVHVGDEDSIDDFINRIPKDTEVIVDFRYSMAAAHSYFRTYIYGTALIPKKKRFYKE